MGTAMDLRGLEQIGQDDPLRYKEMLGMFLEFIPSSVLVINRDSRIAFANKNFVTKSRRGPLDVIGRRLEHVLPEAIIEHMDMTSKVRQVFDSKQAIRGDRMTYRAPGIPIRIYYYSILPFDWRGEVETVVLLMDDVTEQVRLSEEVRLVERHLASVVESARDIVLSTGPAGEIVTWNAAAERLTGFGAWEVKGRYLFERCAPEGTEDLRRVFHELRAADRSQTGEWEILTKTGERIPMSWIFSPLKDEGAKSVGIVAVGRDLSEHRKLEMQLLQSQKLAALGVMAGGIAHEIRNPLAVCSSAAQFLKNPAIRADLREECIDRILSGVHKASSIIENLLRFARPSSTTEMTQLDLLDVVRDAFELVSNQARIAQISVSVDFPDQKIAVYGNANLLQQMFLNLVLNAVNSMPDGGRLRISAKRIETGAEVDIEDTGCGISQEHIEKIFDPFFTLSPVGKGTGLGLSICYSIVKQHLGNIEVDSSVGAGTVFKVQLPVL